MAGRVLYLCLRLSAQQSLCRRGELSPVSTVFMTNRLKSIAVAVCATTWLFIMGANATTVIPPTFEEMTDRAELVFVGKVLSSRSEWRSVGIDRVIFTLVEFETHDVLKGNGGKSVTLQFLGGTVGEATLEVSGVPKFNAGDRVLLFVEGNGIQFCPLVGVFHGKFGVRKDEKTGRDIVVMHDGRPLRDVGEIGNGEGAEFAPKRATVSIPVNAEPMSLDNFKSKVREHVSKRAAQK
jgi:hypothetical protein